MRSVGAERRIRLRTKEDKDNRKAAVLAQSLEVKETKEEYQDRLQGILYAGSLHARDGYWISRRQGFPGSGTVRLPKRVRVTK